MRDYCYTFRSLMQAQHASIVLMQKGILSEYGRTPAFVSAAGCGYGVYVDQKDVQRAAAIFWQEGISFQRGIQMSEWSRNML